MKVARAAANALVAGLGVAAALLGACGIATLMVERELARIAAIALDVDALHYNPLTGTLALSGVRAGDGEGRLVFSAQRIEGRVSPIAIATGHLTFRRLHVVSPALATGSSDAAEFLALAGQAVTTRGDARSTCVRVDDFSVSGGSLVIRPAVDGGVPLIARDIEIRTSRVGCASRGSEGRDAFVVDMAAWGGMIRLAGHALTGDAPGFLLRVRGKGIDVAAAVRDLGPDTTVVFAEGRGDVDADVLLAEGRLLVSGSARVGPFDLIDTDESAPAFRARGLYVAVDKLDVTARTGRISRLDLLSPSVTLVTNADGRVALPPLLAELAELAPGLVVRRFTVKDGEIRLAAGSSGPGVALRDVQLLATTHELRGSTARPVVLDGRAGIGREGALRLSGSVTRDLRSLDAAVTVERLPISPWRRSFVSAVGFGDGLLSFRGRLRLEPALTSVRATLSGRATVVPPSVESSVLTADVRRLEWSSGSVVDFDGALSRGDEGTAVPVPANTQ